MQAINQSALTQIPCQSNNFWRSSTFSFFMFFIHFFSYFCNISLFSLSFLVECVIAIVCVCAFFPLNVVGLNFFCVIFFLYNFRNITFIIIIFYCRAVLLLTSKLSPFFGYVSSLPTQLSSSRETLKKYLIHMRRTT